MATLYTRVYTYTGQGSWSSGARNVKLSAFAVSGDTDKSIGRIVSIQYEHYHASTSYKEWALQGGLYYSSSNTFTSDTVTKTIGSSDVVKFVNTFTSLPTASQFETLVSGGYVRTLTGGSYAQTSSPYLTWRADAARPMRLIVSFYEEPPWVYRPQILSFDLKRGDANGNEDDSGTRALLTLKLGLASTAYQNLCSVKLHYSTGNVSAASPSINLSSYISPLLVGVTNNRSYITTTFEADFDWNFLLVFTCVNETAVASAVLQNSKVALHVSENGVAIGDQVANGTADAPTFECYNPAYFYGGIAQIGGSGTDMAAQFGVKAGSVQNISIKGSATTTGAVSFGMTFASPPIVVATLDSTPADSDLGEGRWDYVTLTVRDITTTGFSACLKNGTSTAFKAHFNWIAVGIPG